jgi:DNA polymerase
VQATANDILRHSLRAFDAEKFNTVIHVHDEIVVECPSDQADRVANKMLEIMCTPPDWAKGLPLAAEGVTTTRYS